MASKKRIWPARPMTVPANNSQPPGDDGAAAGHRSLVLAAFVVGSVAVTLPPSLGPHLSSMVLTRPSFGPTRERVVGRSAGDGGQEHVGVARLVEWAPTGQVVTGQLGVRLGQGEAQRAPVQGLPIGLDALLPIAVDP